MAATSKTKRGAGRKSTKKSSRTGSKTKRSRSTTARASTRKSSSRASATKKKSTAKRTARKAPARKRSTRTAAKTSTKTSSKKRAPALKATNITAEDRKFLQSHAGELSESTLRARWIHSPNEHEDHPGQTLATRDHEVIMHWADERKAVPATVPGTEHGDRPGVLRLNFPGYGGGSLEQIDWDDWFAPFDERELVFVFQEHKSDGSQSNFFHFDNPTREHA